MSLVRVQTCSYRVLTDSYLDVLLGDYLSSQVAVKVLKDKTMVQQFLTEAYVMTYVTVLYVSLFSGSDRIVVCLKRLLLLLDFCCLFLWSLLQVMPGPLKVSQGRTFGIASVEIFAIALKTQRKSA